MMELESGCKELGDQERENGGESMGGGWWWWCMKCWCWGCLRDGHPLAVQRRRTAPRGLMAAQCHMAAEEGLEGAAGQVGA